MNRSASSRHRHHRSAIPSSARRSTPSTPSHITRTASSPRLSSHTPRLHHYNPITSKRSPLPDSLSSPYISHLSSPSTSCPVSHVSTSSSSRRIAATPAPPVLSPTPPPSSSTSENTAWYLLQFDLLVDPRIDILLANFTPSPRHRRLRPLPPHPVFDIATTLPSSRSWTTVARSVQPHHVTSVTCPPACVNDMRIRVTLRSSRDPIATAEAKLASLLDPARSPGASGGGGVLRINVTAGKTVAGKLQLRAVVAPRAGVQSAYGLTVEVLCASAIRRDMKGTVIKLTRRGGKRQVLPLAEVGAASRGDRFDEVHIGKERLFFGLGDGASRSARLRLEVERMRGGMFSTKKERVHVASLDFRLDEMQSLNRGASFTMSCADSSHSRELMTCVLEDIHSRSDHVKLRLKIER